MINLLSQTTPVWATTVLSKLLFQKNWWVDRPNKSWSCCTLMHTNDCNLWSSSYQTAIRLGLFWLEHTTMSTFSEFECHKNIGRDWILSNILVFINSFFMIFAVLYWSVIWVVKYSTGWWPPSIWSTQKYKYEWQISSSWAILTPRIRDSSSYYYSVTEKTG